MSKKKETKPVNVFIFDASIDGLECMEFYHPETKSLLVCSLSDSLPSVAGVKRFVFDNFQHPENDVLKITISNC